MKKKEDDENEHHWLAVDMIDILKLNLNLERNIL